MLQSRQTEFIMSKCIRCKIKIADDAVMCPLCHGVLEQDEQVDNVENKDVQPGDLTSHASRSVMYPDVEIAMRKMRLVTRATVFFAIVAECIAAFINYLTYDGVMWSIVSGIALIYACFTLIYSVKRNRSHQRKMIVQLVVALVMFLAVDMALGYSGWSVMFAMPGAIIMMDIGIFVLMLVNRKNWQNYIMPQIWMIIVSLICSIPAFRGAVEFPIIIIAALLLSIFCFAGSVVFGDKKAASELNRRFHM